MKLSMGTLILLFLVSYSKGSSENFAIRTSIEDELGKQGGRLFFERKHRRRMPQAVRSKCVKIVGEYTENWRGKRSADDAESFKDQTKHFDFTFSDFISNIKARMKSSLKNISHGYKTAKRKVVNWATNLYNGKLSRPSLRNGNEAISNEGKKHYDHEAHSIRANLVKRSVEVDDRINNAAREPAKKKKAGSESLENGKNKRSIEIHKNFIEKRSSENGPLKKATTSGSLQRHGYGKILNDLRESSPTLCEMTNAFDKEKIHTGNGRRFSILMQINRNKLHRRLLQQEKEQQSYETFKKQWVENWSEKIQTSHEVHHEPTKRNRAGKVIVKLEKKS